MGDALLSGVSGLVAYQKMLDVTGSNLANVNTTAYKASSVTFADMLGETMRSAEAPSASTGGTNPVEIGSGVSVANINLNMSQGSLVSTGQPLDMAIEGAGYFVLNDGQKDVYTRAGSFSVDSQNYLVDPATGYRVQRTGTDGVSEGFQSADDSGIRIPYDVSLPAKPTSAISMTGNLIAGNNDPTTNVLTSDTAWTVAGGAAAGDSTLLTDITGSTAAAGDTITITGTTCADAYAGGAAAGTTFTIGADSTVGDLLTAINTAFPGSTATMNNGNIVLTDNASGYSQTSLNMTYTPDPVGNPTGTFAPTNFDVTTAGGADTCPVSLSVVDAQGVTHNLAGTFVRTNTANQWDLVVTPTAGDVQLSETRIDGISFRPDGSFGGLVPVTGPDGTQSTGSLTLGLTYPGNASSQQTVTLSMGTVGGFAGLSQVGGTSGQTSAVTPTEDGYASGTLSSMSVTSNGVLVGIFTDAQKVNLASIKMATFQNPAGLDSIGNNYFDTSANSGNALDTQAQSGGAGSIVGGSLETSNVDTATEFVNLIQAQNGYAANARTISVANQMLTDLTNLIR
jgi:flagellar hook protein FlgE